MTLMPSNTTTMPNARHLDAKQNAVLSPNTRTSKSETENPLR